MRSFKSALVRIQPCAPGSVGRVVMCRTANPTTKVRFLHGPPIIAWLDHQQHHPNDFTDHVNALVSPHTDLAFTFRPIGEPMCDAFGRAQDTRAGDPSDDQTMARSMHSHSKLPWLHAAIVILIFETRKLQPTLEWMVRDRVTDKQ